jgi:hypothetical protein
MNFETANERRLMQIEIKTVSALIRNPHASVLHRDMRMSRAQDAQ